VASAFGGGDAPAGGAEPGPGARDQARRKPPAVPDGGGPPAISAASAAASQLRAEPSDAPTAATPPAGLDPAAASEAMTAMLTSVPGVNFGDPLGSGGSLSSGDLGPVEMPAMPQDQDPWYPNGSERAI
jgi:hypothetical protein